MAEMGALRVLVVDDEAPLLELLRKYLVRQGWVVDACSRAEDALELFAKEPASYRLVMADLSLPEMPGETLVQRLLELNPAVRILVCSGYPFTGSDLGRQVGFLQKPFVPAMLNQAIEELMGK